MTTDYIGGDDSVTKVSYNYIIPSILYVSLFSCFIDSDSEGLSSVFQEFVLCFVSSHTSCIVVSDCE